MDSHATIAESGGQEKSLFDFEDAEEAETLSSTRHLQFEDFDDSTAEDEPSGEDDVAKVAWDTKQPTPTVIKVIGVGGGGCNAVQNMVSHGFEGVEFYAINTDYQALQRTNIPNRIQIGEHLTQGSGAGALPSIGEQAARDAEDRIREILTGADMVFITAGLGGGTGTGAAPVIAEIARSMDILNVAIVTKPFHFEGTQRMRRAEEGLKKLAEHVDTTITIINDKLMEVVGPKTPLTEAFDIANTVLGQGIRAISDLIAVPGLINVDFRDVRTIMGETGGAVMGVGIGKGENRSIEAVRKACQSPLQEKIVIDGARGVLINITGPSDISMHEINEATSLIYEMADPEANVIFGVVIDENMHDSMRVTIIATGFGDDEAEEGLGEGLAAKPKLRPDTLPLSEPGSAAAIIGRETDSEIDHQPAILRKRERDSGARPKIDFDSPDNPLHDWDDPLESPGGSGPSDGEAESPSASSTGPAVFSDSEPGEKAPGPDDPDYETPALHRRRRQRFFE